MNIHEAKTQLSRLSGILRPLHVKLLLDTDVLLWAATDPTRLSSEAREALEAGTHEALVSAVTGWEIASLWRVGAARVNPRDRAPAQ